MAALTSALVLGGLAAAGTIGAAAIGSSAQTKAANKAAATQQNMFNIGREALDPFIQGGQRAAGNMFEMLDDPYFSKPIDMTVEGLEKTPGYQFMRDQGLKSVQNAYAARGLGSSGAAMKGAANFATGLAQNNWQNVFNVESQQRNNIFGRAMSAAQMGAGAAGALGGQATATGGNMGNAYMGAGNAQAAAAMAGGNAFSNFANTAGGYLYMQPYMKQAAAGSGNWGGNVTQGWGG